MTDFIEKGFGRIILDNASGIPVDLSATVMSIQIAANRQVGSFYVLGEDFSRSNDGKASWTATLSFYMSLGAAEAYAHLQTWMMPGSNLRPGARTIMIDTPDSEIGSRRLEGEARIESLDPLMDIDASSTDVQRVTARLRGDGELTPSIVAT